MRASDCAVVRGRLHKARFHVFTLVGHQADAHGGEAERHESVGGEEEVDHVAVAAAEAAVVDQ